MSYHNFGQDIYCKTQAAERAEMLLDKPEFVMWMSNLVENCQIPTTDSVGGHRAGHILRLPVVAAMYATWLKCLPAATEFWEAIRDESGAENTSPDRKLARYLNNTRLRARHDIRRGNNAGNREVYVKCLHAWNAWRKGEETNLRYHSDAKIPDVR